MVEYLKFIKDRSILTALLLICIIELSMQMGCYKGFLKKNSYAANVNRITEHVLSKQTELDPDILIVGTSLAYQGLSVPMLNKRLSPLKVQSVAIPGGELIVQNLSLEKTLSKFKNVKYIIHVNEAEIPWVDYRTLSDGTLAMISEFDRKRVIQKIYEDKYTVKHSDLVYIIFKLVTYRRDIADLILNFDRRVKDYGRMRKTVNTNTFDYENQYMQNLAMYPFTNIDECLKISSPVSPIASGSDEFHKNAIYRTCQLAKESNLGFEKNELTGLYYHRLSTLYQYIRSKNITLINVFPPLPYYLDFIHYPKRIEFWKTEFRNILGDTVINLHNCIPKEESPKYFYDLIHLNRPGMEIFTNALSNSLAEKFNLTEEGKK
jgi:hypothetical protein